MTASTAPTENTNLSSFKKGARGRPDHQSGWPAWGLQQQAIVVLGAAALSIRGRTAETCP